MSKGSIKPVLKKMKTSPQYAFRKIPQSAIPSREDMEGFEYFLLGLPIFEKRKNHIRLRSPEYPQTINFKEGEEGVIFDLSLTLFMFFQRNRIDPESNKKISSLLSALNALLSCKRCLIDSQVVDEKTFMKTCDRFAKWVREYISRLYNPISPQQRTTLVKSLYDSFEKTIPRLKSTARFFGIAHILKGFGIEEGSIKNIYGRIKVDFYRKR